MSVRTIEEPGLLDSIRGRCVQPRADCMIWPDAVDRGYGRVWVDGQAKRVHRVVWELENGPIPDGLTVDHLCRVRYCVNTAHMELVTVTENLARKPASDRCRNGHEYAAVGETTAADGSRLCVACKDAANERRRLRRRP